MQTNKYAIIVAGGVGSRSGDSLPKQFHDIGGHPMLWWTLKAFEAEDKETKLIVVMHADYIDLWNKTAGEECPCHTVVAGGSTRTASVAAGLSMVPDYIDGLVAVHDAARPLASPGLISEGWRYATQFGAVVPAVPVSDSLREGTKENSHSVDRSRFFAVQTPQVFDIKLLKEAYKSAADSPGVSFTDDASVVEWNGKTVTLFDGDPRNIKVTYPGDFRIASEILLQ
ncbi:MAG: 2-C-methyl-D-erythritol 4-phosphate cytidylyltransferase [Muribaculaceae bacterium]|nr:2-C-methyl-D-erythritol 4-phosphate cytidylyltransferase [Muribaculaceae bacterium]